jgi:7-carboxy-7-deazaguanine synthase
MSISPKLANSTPPEGRAGDWRGKHEARRLNLPVLTSLIERYEYQFKFVVREQSDVAEILWLCDQLPRIKREFVLLMPEGIDWATLESRRQWILAACRKYGFTFCPRLHILWYGNTRGT